MNAAKRVIQVLVCSYLIAHSGLLPACAQDYSKELEVTGNQEGPFMITAVVKAKDPAPLAALTTPGDVVNRLMPGHNAPSDVVKETSRPRAVTTQEVNQIVQQLANQFRQQQKQLANQLAQLQAQQQAQQAQTQLQQAQIQPQQAWIQQLYFQYRQDQIMRYFEQYLLANGMMNTQALSPLGPDDGNNLMSLIAGLLGAAGQMAQQQQAQVQSDQIANQLQQLASSLPEETAGRIMDALNNSTNSDSAKRLDDQIQRFASLNDKLAHAVNSTGSSSLDMTDYERLAKLSDDLGASNRQTAKQFLELSMESAGRAASDRKLGDEQRKKARDFAIGLAGRFAALRTEFGANPTMADQQKELDFDLEKCVRIGTGKDVYAP